MIYVNLKIFLNLSMIRFRTQVLRLLITRIAKRLDFYLCVRWP